MSAHSSVDNSLRKVALALGFLAVAASALVARANPATGYELSLFTMTPPAVWVGLLVALSVALAVAFVPAIGGDRGRRDRSFAVVLGGLVMTVFAGLPIIRGYRFYGHHDALTHLGWARAIAEGTLFPFELYYPGIHTVAVFINSALEMPLSRSMLFVVFLAVLVFCTFVPLAVGTIVRHRRGTVLGAFAAFLLLPITTISMYLEAHAMSQAVLLSALLVYLLAKYLRTDRDLAMVSSIGVAFALASAATILYHPQLVAHLLVVFLGICAVQFLARRIASGSRIARQTPLYAQTGFLIAAFLLWMSNHSFVLDIVGYFFGTAIEFILEGGGRAGDTVAMQGASLEAIGGSLLEIFFKLFFSQLVFTLLAGLLVLGVLTRSSRFADVRAETTYFVVGLLGLGGLFGVYFVVPESSMHFRVFGLAMLFVTILGAISIHGLITKTGTETNAESTTSARGRGWLPSAQPVVAVGFALLLVLSLAAVFPSPYTYNASPHVSDQHMEGYETAFEDQEEDVRFVGLRNGPNRIHDAINGNEERMRLHQDLSHEAIETGLANHYDEDRYLALTQADYERELEAYRGLRYTEEDLESATTQPGVNRVQSNGEFELYYVESETPTA